MVPSFRRSRLILPAASTIGIATGVVLAIGFALVPVEILERLVLASGLPTVVAAAEPPLGVTARLVLILIGGGFAGFLTWFALFPLIGHRAFRFGGADRHEMEATIPVVRRADAHPDAPPRAPLFAHRDLGTPFLDIHAPQVAGPLDDPAGVPVDADLGADLEGDLDADVDLVRDLPDNLDMPLAAFDPEAFAAATGEPAPLPRFAPGERIETFELTPIVRSVSGDAPLPVRQAPSRDTEATIAALLERLERGVTERAERLPRPGSDAALGTLRRLAAGY
jgi:hypothetical protein